MVEFGWRASSGGACFGVVCHVDAVVELESFDLFWQLVPTFQAESFIRGSLNSGEHHQLHDFL
jgi:hypothetical protein